MEYSPFEKLIVHQLVKKFSTLYGPEILLLRSQETPLVKVKVNVKLSLRFNWAPRHESVLGEWRYISTHSLISALDGGEWSASHPGRFTPS